MQEGQRGRLGELRIQTNSLRLRRSLFLLPNKTHECPFWQTLRQFLSQPGPDFSNQGHLPKSNKVQTNRSLQEEKRIIVENQKQKMDLSKRLLSKSREMMVNRREVNRMTQETAMKFSPNWTTVRPDEARPLRVYLRPAIAPVKLPNRRSNIVSITLVFITTIGLLQNGCPFSVRPGPLNMVQANNQRRHGHHHHSNIHDQIQSSVDDLEELGQHQQHTQQGASWSHWWSYDGISGKSVAMN